MIGSVPADLAKIVPTGIENGKVTDAHAIYTGVILHEGSFIGGDSKLPSVYFQETRDNIVVDEINPQF